MKSCRILIIDDEVDLCHLLQSYLSRKEYDVHIAHSLRDGLLKLQELKPQIVFLDNNLPDGEGWKEVPHICASYPALQLNLISAFHPAVPEMAAKSKNIRVIEKPISLKEIDSYLSC